MNRIIKIVILTALIAVTLGMTSLPTVLSPKPSYTVTVTVYCGTYDPVSGLLTLGYGGVILWKYDKTGIATNIGAVDTSYENCATVGGDSVSQPFSQKPDAWEANVYVLNPDDPLGAPAECKSHIGMTSSPLTTYPAQLIVQCPGPIYGNLFSADMRISAMTS